MMDKSGLRRRGARSAQASPFTSPMKKGLVGGLSLGVASATALNFDHPTSGSPFKGHKNVVQEGRLPLGDLSNRDSGKGINEHMQSRNKDQVALIIQDRYSHYIQGFPAPNKTAEETIMAFLRYLGPNVRPGHVYSDNSKELNKAMRKQPDSTAVDGVF